MLGLLSFLKPYTLAIIAAVVVATLAYVGLLKYTIKSLKVDLANEKAQVLVCGLKLQKQNKSILEHETRSNELIAQVSVLNAEAAAKEKAANKRIQDFMSQVKPDDATCCDATNNVREFLQ